MSRLKYNTFSLDGTNSSYFTFRHHGNAVPSFNIKINTIFLRFYVIFLGIRWVKYKRFCAYF
ncbi:hypothetical protein Hanom_Chr14g01319181 [Helianthus anomalus]